MALHSHYHGMNINWKDLFLLDLDWNMAAEIALRTLIMFLFVLVFLRMTGKKGVRQLTIFEVAIIIALGSAAGDPMLNQTSAIIPSLLVFAVILALYRLLTYFAAKSERFENVLEGEPMYVVEDGQFTLNSEHVAFAKDEFFAEMRNEQIEHVGQVKTAILETNGKVSFYFYPDDEVRPGLPVLPKIYGKRSKEIPKKAIYACTTCGTTETLDQQARCSRCNKEEWVEALSNPRVT